MTHEKEVEILMNDHCTRYDAERHLRNETVIYDAEDFEKNYREYYEGWLCGEEEIQEAAEMIRTGVPLKDWGISHDNEGNKYYIMYVL